MGNAQSKRWDKVERTHRLLGLALSDTTYMDPRHLEHFSYPLWNTELMQLVAMSGRMDLMVAPQFPMWVSADERPILSSDPNTSGNTEPDGTAQSVNVDLAIYQPIVLPRLLRFFPSIQHLLRDMTLHKFIIRVAANDGRIAKLPPRCLWVDELSAPILMEVKKPATRHPKTLKEAVRSVHSEMTEGQRQAVEQGTCQSCSWRFASQQVAILIAATHDLWSFRRFTRDEAAELFGDNDRFDPTDLIEVKIKMEAGIKPPSEPVQDLLYSSPQRASEAKKTIQQQEREAREQEREEQKEERKTRAQNRALARENPPEDPEDDPEPNYDDRSLPLFADEDLDRLHTALYNEPLFEARDPVEFFGSVRSTTATEWSRVLRLGTPLSDQYKQFLAGYLKHAAEKEESRRKESSFKSK